MQYKNPTPTVDIIITKGRQIVLIKRRNNPVGWALPGGFIDEGESVEQAALREAKEETNLDITLQDLLYVYSDPQRDPRKHTISIVFTATAEGKPIADDDAQEAKYFDLNNLPSPLVFDHAKIIDDYSVYLMSNRRPSPTIV